MPQDRPRREAICLLVHRASTHSHSGGCAGLNCPWHMGPAVVVTCRVQSTHLGLSACGRSSGTVPVTTALPSPGPHHGADMGLSRRPPAEVPLMLQAVTSVPPRAGPRPRVRRGPLTVFSEEKATCQLGSCWVSKPCPPPGQTHICDT